jgi:hypothetical protein
MLLKKGLDMTIKCILLYLLFLPFVKLSYSQISCIQDSTAFFDADSIRLGIYYKTNEKIDSIEYWDLEKHKIDVYFEVPEYKYSYDSLENFLLEQFRMLVNYEEVNGAALVYILLDSDSIKEIRIGKRIGYHSKYDSFVKETLMKTQGNWVIPDNADKPILFVYLFKMK